MPSSNGQNIRAIGGMYASQGYCVVFPDLLGYSNLYPGEPHSYATSYQQNIQSAVVSLNRFYSSNLAKNLKTVNLHIIGFSEGASYAIWF